MTDTQRDEAIDVRLLGRQDLPTGDFPGGKGEVFRAFFTPEVHDAIWKHATETVAVEICGVLVGTWQRDAQGPFVRVSESIRGESAESKFAEVTFTHETWNKINTQMDSKFAHLAIVGWYHTHPDFGVFLSDRDCFIQEHFFAGAGQIAHVVDPVRKTEGVFVWRDGKPKLAEHFWVGDRILMGTAAGSETPPPGMASASDHAHPTAASPPRGSILSITERLLVYLCVFLLGNLLSSFWNNWQRQYVEEGVVTHFAYSKLLRIGLNEDVEGLALDLLSIAKATRKLEAHAVAKDRDESIVARNFREVEGALDVCVDRVLRLKTKYGLSATEQDAVKRIEAILLERSADSKPEKGEKPSTEAQPEPKPKPVEKTKDK